MTQEDLEHLETLIDLYITGHFGTAAMLMVGKLPFAKKVKVLDYLVNPPDEQKKQPLQAAFPQIDP